MTPIKILHTIRQGHIGGGETHVHELVRHLDQEKYECYVLAFSEGDMHDKLNSLGVPSYIIPSSSPFDLTVRKKVRSLAEEIKPDIIHAHGARACSNSYFLASELNIPLLYTVHGWTFRKNMNFFQRIFRRFSESFLSNKADVVINVSYSDLLTGRNVLGIKNSIEIVNGVDPAIFNGKGDKTQKMQFGFEKDDFIIALIARLTDQKDPVTFIRAMEHLKNEEKLKAIIVGDGKLLSELKVLAHKLQLEEKIKFTGSRKDVANILSWTDVYCLPSLWEGMPIGILEAMASGCAVIATDVTGTKEVVNAGTGLLFTPGDHKTLADRITYLYEHPEEKKRMEINAQNHINKYFSIEHMAQTVQEQYAQLS
jgi:glycosyltransferase involved in cell wall biosynthesis